MEDFFFFLIVCTVVVIAFVIYTASVVISRKKNNSKKDSTNPSQKHNDYSAVIVDWRVYAIEKSGNCIWNSDVIINDEHSTFSIGKTNDSDFQIAIDDGISRNHAYLKRDKFEYIFFDNDSTNGSKYKGEYIKSIVIESMMIIWISDTALLFVKTDEVDKINSEYIKNRIQHEIKCGYID